MTAPLPVKNGVGPTRLRIPDDGPWPTIAAFVADRFAHIREAELLRRFDDGEIVGVDGAPIDPHLPLRAHEFLWYYRELPDEALLPHREQILHVDDDLIVIDKPHFLPTTPGGRYLRESALVRLRIRLDNPDIIPIHRLDRPTAGLVMFSARPATRGAYQSLFERRRVTKVYEAVSKIPDADEPTVGGRALPLTHRSHIYRPRDANGHGLRVAIDDHREPNSETVIDGIGAGVSAAGRSVLHTRLHPRTGRMHQLRVHLASLGIPILGDRWYPELLPEAPDDPSLPLQLLARELAFTDPLSGAERRFVSTLRLSEAPA
ncbi:pseudouridine synthase [Gordonia sp. (in: high G+C Gram-positive bacteria)]|uniref:pseudouridine synthase n=1 Tax=Gordonia sp. (in: high G+C Gram-positive bacteria) TaxID=84139 RepID=UPI001697B280|nr:pseudouridine synthase [Gordonia sp. (in: high G+C Gram-positive bacteria)]NLG47115.1 pseudouridine synthase [Gordonia sp. (in: high G+C Gram-positive bacteria)]